MLQPEPLASDLDQPATLTLRPETGEGSKAAEPEEVATLRDAPSQGLRSAARWYCGALDCYGERTDPEPILADEHPVAGPSAILGL